MPLSVISLPISVSGKTIDFFLWVLHVFIQNFRYQISYIFNFCIYPITWLIITKWSCSGQISIFIIKRSHKILKKKHFDCFCVRAISGRQTEQEFVTQKGLLRLLQMIWLKCGWILKWFAHILKIKLFNSGKESIAKVCSCILLVIQVNQMFNFLT